MATTQPPASGTPAIAFIQACWHRDIVDQSRIGFVEEITRMGWNSEAIDTFEVPGAFEIPLQAKLLSESGRYGAIVGAGLVVDGGIYRHDFVATAVINGLMQVQLETRIPIFSVVLTPHNYHEHQEHQNYFFSHFRKKGAEAARAAAQLLGSRP
ncbi:MAG: 6,7-dimethyl-8-ribityllumazine synthase [Burkholderiaceae bacterium]